MTAMILDERMTERLIAERRQLGIDDHDECWDGVYVMTPPPSFNHQNAVYDMTHLLKACCSHADDAVVIGMAVSPVARGWTKNFRSPDVSVVLAGNPLVNHGTHLQGGPDLAVEIRSRGDDSFQKLDFYAVVGVREVLIVDRDTRTPTLFHLDRGQLAEVPTVKRAGRSWLPSGVLPLAFARTEVRGKPKLLVRRTAGAARTWRV